MRAFSRLFLGGLVMLATLPIGAAEIRLEGVNILGASKSAYLSVDGKRGRFREGESMDGWTVERIAPRSVDLRTPEGELRTLTLRGSAGKESPAAAGGNPFGAAPSNASERPAAPSGVGTHFSPKVIDDRDVPPGYRKVRTPFGDVLVDEAKQGNSLIMGR